MNHKITKDQEDFLYELCSFYIDDYDVDDETTWWKKDNYYLCLGVIEDGYYTDEIKETLNVFREFYLYTKLPFYKYRNSTKL